LTRSLHVVGTDSAIVGVTTESSRSRTDQAHFGGAYNSVLLNRYADGKDAGLGTQDDEPEMDPNTRLPR